ncbi:MAG TPA: hypothetical protein VN081_01270 [Dongiaceae bacterium]|nr:hypothetical protein [Dongiaceae bacterium]
MYRNADFDGDQLNNMIVLDDYMWQHVLRLSPHLGVMDLMNPWTVSRNIAIPVPVLATINNWLQNGITNITTKVSP